MKALPQLGQLFDQRDLSGRTFDPPLGLGDVLKGRTDVRVLFRQGLDGEFQALMLAERRDEGVEDPRFPLKRDELGERHGDAAQNDAENREVQRRVALNGQGDKLSRPDGQPQDDDDRRSRVDPIDIVLFKLGHSPPYFASRNAFCEK